MAALRGASMRRLTLLQEHWCYDTVRDLVQFGLDLQNEIGFVGGPLALRAIESTTGKRSGFTVQDVLVSIGKEINNAQATLPREEKLSTKKTYGLDGGFSESEYIGFRRTGVYQPNGGTPGQGRYTSSSPEPDPTPNDFDTPDEFDRREP